MKQYLLLAYNIRVNQSRIMFDLIKDDWNTNGPHQNKNTVSDTDSIEKRQSETDGRNKQRKRLI